VIIAGGPHRHIPAPLEVYSSLQCMDSAAPTAADCSPGYCSIV